MKYREIILALLPAALLAGCSENTISDEAVYESSAAETSAPVTQVVTESAVMPETSSVTSVTAESDAELPDADEKVTFTYSIEQSEEITGDDVLNIFDQSGNQVLSICQPFIDDMKICFDDYNFDGYDDLRITTGTDGAGEGNSFAFYRYEPSTGLYQEWPELNALPAAPFTDWRNSSLFFDIPEYDDNVLRDNTYVYVWDKGKLKPGLRRESVTIFAENDGIYHTMYYVYKYDENGNEYQYDMFSEPKTVGG